MRRVVYSEINIVMPILAYSHPAFFIMRFAVVDMN